MSSKSKSKKSARPGRPLKPSAPPGAKRVDSLTDLARALGYSTESLRKAKENGEIIVAPDGTMSVEQARAAMLERAERGRQLGKNSEWREREQRAKALEREVKLQKTVEKLVDKDEVRMEWDRAVTRVKQAMLGIGRELAPTLVNKGPHEIQALIDVKIFEVLRNLAHATYSPG